ncbi:TlyA family RNA methyltransferase [Lyngbya confervoides]|uniref:TlyA family RNA methyltransferase n=1 Tax=Lyngbya confervoides BDU141951 TaxID=1574623 RepID=A0ABD4T3C8_9CYAN|nr:TlyA family RNA methyltransferase [Lyngbya confervoides]MCM1983178.1 TlyA family RNA methyltransferase [Lyngbya confervoides BDU141951]
MSPKKQRLDKLIVDLGLCESRQTAQRYIRAGAVQVNHQVIDKPGTLVAPELPIHLKARSPYVSRGAEKLLKALQTFPISVDNRICLDGGISTGGFTDCLLQAGAQQVYGVDVGYGQVAWKLRQDPRVVLKERTNLRHLTPATLYGPTAAWATLGVMDVSFISLTKVLPAFWELLSSPKEMVLLVKPQFEVGKDRVGKHGVVRDPDDHAQAICQVLHGAQSLGWQYQGLTYSPISGPAGNLEYLLWCSHLPTLPPPTAEDISATIAQTTREAQHLLRI